MINIDALNDEEKLAALESIHKSIAESKEIQKKKITTNVELIVKALKKIESDLQKRYDETGQLIANLKNGEDGRDGRDGKDGKNGKDGRDGPMGPRGFDGVPGRNGLDGADGVSITDAHIDFDGSLIIHLSSGRVINVGEVVAADIAEKIKVITNGGGTSQSVLDAIASLQAQISAITGGLDYQGTWNASTNTPTLTSSVGTNGEYYVVSTAGSTNLNGVTDWQVGDWAIFNGSTWQKLDQTNLVTSVAGRTGAITLTTADIGGLGTIATQAANNVSITGGSITGITDLAVADGGTGASTAPNARINLGLVIGTDVLSPTGSAASLTSFPTFNQNTTGTASNVTGTVAIANGGTGQTTANAAFNALVPSQTGNSGKYLTTDGTNSSWATNPLGTVTSVAQSFTGGLISVAGSPITTSGTLALTVAGTSGGIPYFSGTSTWASSSLLASNALMVGGGAATAPSTVTTGTGVVTALGVNTGSSGAFVVNGGALGTPSSGTVTNLTGTASININGTVGATTATTGAFTTLSASSTVTLSGGTANGVTYLNGSKVLTSGSALTFDGTNLGVGTSSPADKLEVYSTITARAGSGTSALRLRNTTSDYQWQTVAGTNAISLFDNAVGSARLTLDSSGNLGIGTSSPSSKLHVSGGRTLAITGNENYSLGIGRESNTNAYYLGVHSTTNPNLLFSNNAGTTNMTLTYDGNLGLGVTPSAWDTAVFRTVQIGSGVGSVSLSGRTDGGKDMVLGSNLYYGTSNFRYVGTGTATMYRMDGATHLWSIAASGTAGNAITFTQAMTLDASGNLGIGTTSPSTKLQVNDTITIGTADKAIQWLNSGTALADIRADSSSNLIFRNTSSYTERARIDSSGNFVVGNTSTSARIESVNNSATQRTLQATNVNASMTCDGLMYGYSATARGTGFNFLSFQNDTAVDFKVLGNGNVQNTNNSYGAISDAKLKENIVDATPKLADLMQVKVRNYNLIGDTSKQLGVVAQELQTVFPAMVDELPDRDAEGNILETTTKSVKYSVFVPMLIKAIQEQQAIIESLKARLDAANL